MKIHDQIKNSNHLIRIFDLRKKRCFQSCSRRSKRFWLVSEQRKTEERAFRFGCSRIETRALLLAPCFALSLTLVPRSLLQDSARKRLLRRLPKEDHLRSMERPTIMGFATPRLMCCEFSDL